MNYIEVLKKLNETSGSIAKKKILRDNMTEDLKNILKYTYDISYVYGIKQVPDIPDGVEESDFVIDTSQLRSIIELLEALHARDITGNMAKDAVSSLMETMTYDHCELLTMMLKRDLRIGAGRTMINSVLEDLKIKTIEKFELMACQSLNEKTIKNISFPAYAQLKCDAARCAIMFSDDEVVLRTRNGKYYAFSGDEYISNEGNSYNYKRYFEGDAYKNVLDFCKKIKTTHGLDEFVIDGELWFSKGTTNTPRPRQETNGMANKMLKGTLNDLDYKYLRITVWDIIPLDDFFSGSCDTNYQTRLDTLVMTYVHSAGSTVINVVPGIIVSNVDEALEWAKQLMAQGEEGIILKDMNSPWTASRSKYWLKVKAKLQADMKIVDIEEGTGRLESSMGRITVESADGIVRCGVGTGFSDSLRAEIWNNKSKYLGKIVTVEYNALSESDGKYSLYLPVFIETREDKNDADTFDKIKEGT